MVAIEHLLQIRASRTKVYEALTTQEGLGAVWTTKLTVKAEPGFVNEFNWGEDYITKMQILELRPEEKVLWECTDSDPEWVGTFICFKILPGQDGVTTLILKHYNWQEVTDYYRSCNYYWAMFLHSLKKYLEEGKGTPYSEDGK
ncbi:SRPBCC domain-containing protein [Chitinophaga filiformis]|uniref:SRPBCC family protein n=1 Tax=Chitinophaga filiformis TaxID=104663 RepID=UPI001F268DE3|nr:SRPBCC domain-containing protein [Chitinophaga filiformis]MCF6405231.1 SRPBCC domain-containing protein [Chitinophaga filiformis]